MFTCLLCRVALCRRFCCRWRWCWCWGTRGRGRGTRPRRGERLRVVHGHHAVGPHLHIEHVPAQVAHGRGPVAVHRHKERVPARVVDHQLVPVLAVRRQVERVAEVPPVLLPDPGPCLDSCVLVFVSGRCAVLLALLFAEETAEPSRNAVRGAKKKRRRETYRVVSKKNNQGGLWLTWHMRLLQGTPAGERRWN